MREPQPVSKPVTDHAPRAVPIVISNRQRTRRVDIRRLRALAGAALAELGATAEVGIHLVSAREMARVNWDFLRHEGSTDVITFDHGSTPDRLHGELFISVADAVAQAAEFGTTWDEELARYVIHGLLHLRGYDDLEPAKRRVMKREENRLVRKFAPLVAAEVTRRKATSAAKSASSPRRPRR